MTTELPDSGEYTIALLRDLKLMGPLFESLMVRDLPVDAEALGAIDRAEVPALRRVLLHLYMLLKTHLSERELYTPILEDRLTSAEEAALARALDHQAVEPL